MTASVLKSAQEQVARVRVCNYVKFKSGRNLLPVLKIVTHPARVHCMDISYYALLLNTHVTGCSIFGMVLAQTMGFYWSYTLLL